MARVARAQPAAIGCRAAFPSALGLPGKVGPAQLDRHALGRLARARRLARATAARALRPLRGRHRGQLLGEQQLVQPAQRDARGHGLRDRLGNADARRGNTDARRARGGGGDGQRERWRTGGVRGGAVPSAEEVDGPLFTCGTRKSGP